MTKYVRETKAGKSISVYVILRKDGTECASVSGHWSDAGVCLVNVFNYGPNNPSEGFQFSRASGYGYDKFTHALSGLEIDGHKMTDHCAMNDAQMRLLASYKKAAKNGLVDQSKWDKKAARIGSRFSNYNRDTGIYDSLYRESGLGFLRLLGYRVIQAI